MRDALSRKYGQIWSSDELRARYEVLGFMARLVVVRDRLTGQKGSLEFPANRFGFSRARKREPQDI